MSKTDQEIIDLFAESVREVDPKVQLGGLAAQTELSSLGLDSVMTMEVIGVLEERLSVRFPDEDLATIQTMNDLMTLVRKLT